MAFLITAMLMTLNSASHSKQMNISCWMKDHHLQLNLSIRLGSSTITSSGTARNLVVVIDDQLSSTDHIGTRGRSCRYALYNIRKIRPFLSEQAAQLLVQALVLSRMDYCNALLADLLACTIKPLQLIQNIATRVFFNELKKAHVNPLFIRSHCLPIAACIKFKVLMFAFVRFYFRISECKATKKEKSLLVSVSWL